MQNNITFDFSVVLHDVELFEKALVAKQQDNRFNDAWHDLGVQNLDDHDNWGLSLDEYWRSADDSDLKLLGDFIKVHVKGDIYCRDDFGEKYRMHFPGDGTWKMQDVIEFYEFNSYEEFVKEYSDTLPDKLMEGLKQWWIAKKV